MTITQLRYVLAVAEYRNFTVAAKHSYVTQPTVSMQVQKLEDELEVRIFDRGKKPIAITEVGQKIVSQAKNIVAEADRIQDIEKPQPCTRDGWDVSKRSCRKICSSTRIKNLWNN